jgi:hypothetical protein
VKHFYVKALKQDMVTVLSTVVTDLATDMVLSTVGLAVREDTAELLKMHKATQETLQAETLEAETVEVVNNDRYNRG